MSIRKVLRHAAVVTVAAGSLLATTAGAAVADPISAASDLGGGALYNADHAIFVVKDLGGGAYWNVTTNSLYVVQTAGQAGVDLVTTAASTSAELLATAVDDGRGTLLLVNGTVLVPAQHALGL